MVYIDKKYPSQHGSVKNGVGKAFALTSNIAFIVDVISLIFIIINSDKAKANLKMDSVAYLWNNFMVAVIAIIFCFILNWVMMYMSKKVQANLISNTYMKAINSIFGVVTVILALIYIL